MAKIDLGREATGSQLQRRLRPPRLDDWLGRQDWMEAQPTSAGVRSRLPPAYSVRLGAGFTGMSARAGACLPRGLLTIYLAPLALGSSSGSVEAADTAPAPSSPSPDITLTPEASPWAFGFASGPMQPLTLVPGALWERGADVVVLDPADLQLS